MDLSNIPNISNNLIDKLFTSLSSASNFIRDTYKIQTSKANYLDKISHLQFVKTLNDFEESISLYDFYVPPRLANVKDKEVFEINDLNDIKAHRKILLSGIVGQGKSVLMRHLAISEVVARNRIPLFYELRYLQKGQTIDQIIKILFKDWLDITSPKVIENVLNSGNITLFLDGFDEIHLEDMPKIVLGFEKLVKDYPKLDFIVSSRSENIIESSSIFQNFQIQKLNLQAQKDIISGLISEPKMKKAVTEGIESSKVEIREALVTPLMVNLFVFIYKNEQIIPEHVKDFYDRLFDLVLRKHDNTKIDFKRQRATKLDNTELKKILQLISFMCCKQEVFAFSEAVFRRLVEKAIQINKLDCDIDSLIFDLTAVLCFIVKEGYLYAFIHKSIPEYFAAEFVRDNGNQEEIYAEIYTHYKKYQNICVFLNTIDEYNFNNLFLKRVYDENIEKLKEKKFIDRFYYKIHDDKINIKIIFDYHIHKYFENDIFEKLHTPLTIDIKKNFKNLNSLTFTISNRTPKQQYENNTDKVQDGVDNKYYDSISNKYETSRSTIAELEESELIKLNYKKISSINHKRKFINSLTFLNYYTFELDNKNKDIIRLLATHNIDDFSF